MLFSIQKELFDHLPDLTIGMVVATGLDNTHPSREIDQLLQQAIEVLKKNFVGGKAQDHPRIKPWRTAFAKLGISGSKFPSSVESMTRRILKRDPFPKINPLVDLYNSISLRCLVPMGGGERVTVPKGELVYRDDQEVLTRNWVWRQCEKDKATEKTRNIFIPIDVLGEVGSGLADEIVCELSESIPKHLGGTIFSAILNRENPFVEFSF